MISYYTAAIALKTFSISPLTLKLYRKIGNIVGQKNRATGPMPNYYVERAKKMLKLSEKFGIINDGSKILEIGTGWLHWEGIVSKLFFDVTGVLYDVWDNRQLSGIKNYLAQLEKHLDLFDISSVKIQHAKQTIKTIKSANSFEELYKIIDFDYIIEKEGTLETVKKSKFDYIVSAGVFEHIERSQAHLLISKIADLLHSGRCLFNLEYKYKRYALHAVSYRGAGANMSILFCRIQRDVRQGQRISSKRRNSFSSTIPIRYFKGLRF